MTRAGTARETPPRLFGRVGERARIDAVLRQAREGRSAALVIRGEAGIGKSALLDYAVGRAGDLTVLGARGFESESEIPFAGLADLLRPVLHLVETLPGPQAAALQSAMSLGPPAGGDRFSVCAATLGMLAAAAAEEPLLVVVDDLHWLDVSSREAILFAARRLNAEGIALLAATRSADVPQSTWAGLPELAVTGLAEADADALLDAVRPGLAGHRRRRIYAETDGNPLGLRELAASEGEEAGATVSRIPLESSLQRVLSGRLGDLPDRSRQALLLVAAGAGEATDVVVRAATLVGLGLADFAPAERAGLLDMDGSHVRFRHPLVRTVLYSSASMHERSVAHAALAQVLAEVAGSAAADGRAWHLAAARVAPDAEVAALLTAAADRARRRSGLLEAAGAYELAARFATAGERAGLLLRAARCWQLAGRSGRILPVLEQALPLAEEPHLRALLRHMNGWVRMWRTRPGEGLRELVEGAEEIERLDAGRAALMYADAAVAHFMHGRPTELLRITTRAFEVAQRAADGGDGDARLVAGVAHAGALVINGRRAEGRALLTGVTPRLLEANPLTRAQELAFAAYIWMWLEDHGTAEALVTRVLRSAREASAVGVLPQALAPATELSYRTGRWSRARAEAQESVALAADTHQTNLYGLYFVARIDAVQGRDADARLLLEQSLQLADRYDAGCVHLYAGHVLGLLALGAGDLDAAIARLSAVRALPVAQQTHDQTIVPWAFDLVEALARAGRPAEAAALLAEHAGGPGNDRADSLEAMALRCRGLLAAREEMNDLFERALRAHDRCEMPFERARTHLLFGERLRRLRSRASARPHLRAALETFEHLDAVHWAARARTELDLTGAPANGAARPASGPAADLTPQELQVAMVVAQGVSNQEAAASLFLSPKTIEYHLSNIYRKTNLRSRDQLSLLTT